MTQKSYSVYWIDEPTETFHGIRVVDHDGTAFIEQVDNDGNDVQSMMFSDPEELDKLIEALQKVAESNP